jgi:hypothetical protein
MPPQRKHDRPLRRQIQCLRRLNLETTETNRRRGIGRSVRYRCCNDIGRRRDKCARKGKHCHTRHSQGRKLGVAEALIGCRRLLQAAIGIDPFGAISMVIRACERHGRRKDGHYARLAGIDKLSEQHGADKNTAQGDTQSAKPAIHGAATNPLKWVHHCRAHFMGWSSLSPYTVSAARIDSWVSKSRLRASFHAQPVWLIGHSPEEWHLPVFPRQI